MDTLPQHAPQKQCTGPCGRVLPATPEYFHHKGENRLTSCCKECRNARLRKAPDAPDGFRRCSQCKEIHPATPEFFSRLSMVKRDGLRSRCKVCTGEEHKQYSSQPEVKERIRAYEEAYQSQPEVKEHRRVHGKVYRSQPEVHEQLLVNKHTRRAREQSAQGTHTAREIREQYKRQSGKCYYCRQKVKWSKRQIDHIVPLARGGSNDSSNLVISCAYCNQSKNDRLLHEWPKGGRLL